MQIKLHEITIREVVDGYVDNAENGVIGYGGKLNIRPAFQREFVYKDKQRDAVIETVLKGFPLNSMYWTESEDGHYELLDGQQRTVSICQYINNDFPIKCAVTDNMPKQFGNLTETEREKIYNYKLFIYICNGNDKERLDWFKVINIAGEKLTDQELRNAVCTGEWLTDAKRYFSKNNCAAYNLANKYVSGTINRQDYLETALKWISDKEGITIDDYMFAHQHDTHATPLWQYFQNVINWVMTTFVHYRKEMKGVEWGILYNKYAGINYNPNELEQRIAELMQDDDVEKRSGIYEYLLSGKEKCLNIRTFTDNDRRAVYEQQQGKCNDCGKEFDISIMEAHHKKRWVDGGHTTRDNCVMLCRECHDKRHGRD
ncbi:MAG: DUF262 domain-containing protein [Corallococcus sp.]|nr:DUF262 domain-containing protein [Corallococcus sp.]MCM1360158.1 DUF262 domain-containing protein [Corallococcus sp.]MCM1395755.1 DUF262 domain-containing protein [Corallococcus sp.]